LADIRLTQASVADAGGVIVGEGAIQAALGVQKALLECAPVKGFVSLMLNPIAPGSAYGVMDGGEILYRASTPPVSETSPYCTLQQLVLPGPVLATDIAPCGASMNPELLTDQALIGMKNCVVL
jgi:hypothetical protein